MKFALAQIRSSNADLRRRGHALTILLVIMAISLSALSAYNLFMGELRFMLVNVAFLVMIAGLLAFNRVGWVRASALLTVLLTIGGSMSLIDDDPGATYIAMTVPVFLSSYVLAPWAGLVVAAAVSAVALPLGVSPLALIVLGVVAVFFYLFADSLDRAYKRSHHQARHDPLTGLPNRDSFNEHLQDALENARKSQRLVAVLFMDLDNFKLINDSLGHYYGDRLLQEVARRLQRCLREGDVAARLGGDEFILLLREIDEPADAVSVAERVVVEIKAPFDLFGQKVTVTTCIGIATHGNSLAGYSSTPALGESAGDPGDMLRNADLALYQAKLRKDSYEVFSQAMHSGAVGRMEMERELRDALDREEFEVYYQPKFTLANRRLIGVEALLRWGSEQRGLVMPSEFIPVAEETGLIVPIGELVIEEACSRASEWYATHKSFEDVTLSVNLSARQFSDPDITSTISRLLESYGLPPDRFQLEITESMLIGDREIAVERLQALRSLGLKIAIDDFGKEYSSLTYLKDLPVDTLKIDQSFVAGLTRGAADVAIVRLIIELAHELGLDVVAEGVESEEQLSQLTALGCELAQGYYFSRPLPASEIESLLRKQDEL